MELFVKIAWVPGERAIVVALLEIGSKESAAASAALRDRLFGDEQHSSPNQVFLLARCYAMAGEISKAERMCC